MTHFPNSFAEFARDIRAGATPLVELTEGVMRDVRALVPLVEFTEFTDGVMRDIRAGVASVGEEVISQLRPSIKFDESNESVGVISTDVRLSPNRDSSVWRDPNLIISLVMLSMTVLANEDEIIENGKEHVAQLRRLFEALWGYFETTLK